MTFNEFCYKELDGLYDPNTTDENQCSGYYKLKENVINNIEPASLEEFYRWREKPTKEDICSIPHPKYLCFLHFNLRIIIIENWKLIMTLEL